MANPDQMQEVPCAMRSSAKYMSYFTSQLGAMSVHANVGIEMKWYPGKRWTWGVPLWPYHELHNHFELYGMKK